MMYWVLLIVPHHLVISLKRAIMTPFLKKSNLDPSQTNNYRPISNLPLLRKILEKFVFKQVHNYLSLDYLYDIYQVGF